MIKLKMRAAMLGALVKGLEILLEQARSRQVATSSVAAEIEAILGLVRKTHSEMQGLYSLTRAANRRIANRVEGPRKSKHVERKVDVRNAMRDVG
jgi:hypothetical protein